MHFLKLAFLFFILTTVGALTPAEAFNGPAFPDYAVTGANSVDEEANLSAAFNEVFEKLPAKMKNEIAENARFSKYNLILKDLQKNHAGQVNLKGQISINRSLLTQPKVLKKTLIHELSHIYDLLKILPPNLKMASTNCNPPGGPRAQVNVSRFCQLYKNLTTSVSTLPEFLEAAGWSQTLNGNGGRTKETTLHFRTADAYELTDSKEMFAVSMEYFLTDPQYQCRRPSMNAFLSKRFEYQPFAKSDCEMNFSYVNAKSSNPNSAILNIDPSRVYQIDYLLAGPGDGLMSAFGHSMLRLVICAPHRNEVGPDCMKDIEYHIALSFRAFVDTPQVNGWNGLTGVYPSRLFFLPLPQVISEYTVSELRDLHSYPLKISQLEKESLLKRAIETHWEYKNQYYFLSNNCAVEVMNLLKSGLLRPELMNSRDMTPKGVLSELNSLGLLDKSAFKDSKVAANQGLFFPSFEANLKMALNILNAQTDESFSIKSYVKLSAIQRLNLFKTANPLTSLDRRKLAASFLLLERYIYKNLTENTYNHFFQIKDFPDSEAGRTAKELVSKMIEVFSSNTGITDPSKLADTGYGIPDAQELESVRNNLKSLQNKIAENQSALDSLVSQMLKLYGAKDVSEVESNISLFAAGLR